MTPVRPTPPPTQKRPGTPRWVIYFVNSCIVVVALAICAMVAVKDIPRAEARGMYCTRHRAACEARDRRIEIARIANNVRRAQLSPLELAREDTEIAKQQAVDLSEALEEAQAENHRMYMDYETRLIYLRWWLLVSIVVGLVAIGIMLVERAQYKKK